MDAPDAPRIARRRANVAPRASQERPKTLRNALRDAHGRVGATISLAGKIHFEGRPMKNEAWGV